MALPRLLEGLDELRPCVAALDLDPRRKGLWRLTAVLMAQAIAELLRRRAAPAALLQTSATQWAAGPEAGHRVRPTVGRPPRSANRRPLAAASGRDGTFHPSGGQVADPGAGDAFAGHYGRVAARAVAAYGGFDGAGDRRTASSARCAGSPVADICNSVGGGTRGGPPRSANRRPLAAASGRDGTFHPFGRPSGRSRSGGRVRRGAGETG